MSASQTEYFPAGHDWRARFPETELVKRAVDLELHMAYEDDAYWIIADESAIAPSLDPVEDASVLGSLVTIARHDATSSLLPALQAHGVGVGDLQKALSLKQR